MSIKHSLTHSASVRAATVVWMAVALLGCGEDAPPPMSAIDAGSGGTGGRDGGSTGSGGGTGAVADAAAPASDAPAPPATDAGSSDSPSAGADGGSTAGIDPTASIAVAPIAWGPCPDDMDPELLDMDNCARVKVPLDYAKPDGEQIELLVGRFRATDPARRIGSLFFNPGGPGEPGVSDGVLSDQAVQAKADIRARFDLVSWDPRGVAASAAVDCKAMPSLPDIERTYDVTSETTQKDALTAAYKTWMEACKSNSKMLPFVGTDATVSDLEILRRAVGDAKLNFVGFSYGTAIGLHYLMRYPDRVRAMALDGVDDFWNEDVQHTDQDVAFEAALKAFFEWCNRASAVDCPFAREIPDKAAAYDALVAAVKAMPVPTPAYPGKSLTANLLPWALSDTLYAEEAWPFLGGALERARMGVGNRLYSAAEGHLGDSGPGEDPHVAIACGDGDPVTAAMVDEYARKVAGFKTALPYAAMACVGWPVANLTRKAPAAVPPIPPVVLIGSTGDPATPYKWATSAAAKLPGSTLITAVAYDHTYYGYGAACIDTPVNAYLLDLTIPAAGIRCEFPDPTAEAAPPGTAALAAKPKLRRTFRRR
jgi:pimeloyl-ACP methyl ester carboxylesterase